MSEKVCSFTGHRQIKSNHIAALPSLIARAIEFAYSEGCRIFMAGGAIGFDTVAAREVIRFRMTHPDVRLHLALPCIAQDIKWNHYQRSAYEYTLREANEVIYISEEYVQGCMAKRNQYLADSADILIAYVSGLNSGAGQTVRMANKRGIRVYNLVPELEKIKT